ncbi:DUF559 domain-containing protein [Tabrizicola sp.]|uniref:DUF559 domain-containing protein n=1 Tax=Tabrizicola sp. TaxID=2005166 RepID=UPI0035267C35
MTPADRALWCAIRNRRFMGLKLRRQGPIGPDIADFYCADHRLVIEADGSRLLPGRSAGRMAGARRLRPSPVEPRGPDQPSGCLDTIAAKVPQH